MSGRFRRMIALSVAMSCATVLEAQTFPLTAAEVADSAALSTSMPRLAAAVLAVYADTATAVFHDNEGRLRILTGQYAEAADALARARQARSADPHVAAHDRSVGLQYEIYARARAEAARSGRPFAEAFAVVFRETVAGLDDRTAARLARALLLSARSVAGDLRWATPDLTGRTTISLAEALTLLRVYSAAEAYRAFAGLPASLIAEDEARRYVIEKSIPVPTPDGAIVCAYVVRPRGAPSTLPALMQFNIYADSVIAVRDALFSAAHGYVGVTGHVRGKACSPDQTVPYRYDGRDAAALIEWIARQPWSDGRVGMFGGSYLGFAAWAAAKHMPPPLKAIMVGAPAGPGIDVPMEGNVFWNFVYHWPFYTTNDRWLDNATYFDGERWTRLFREWYRTGRPYRELEQIDGTPNPLFAEWLSHPTLDDYWRTTVPQGREYAAITIPVLQTAGYFYGGPGAALHYFQEHYRHNPQARHFLLLGPWEHFQAQRGVVTILGDTATFLAGYVIDPVAQIDIVLELRYQWFDHVLKGGPRPRLLRDTFNFQVVGANEWRHVPTLEAAANGRVRFYLSPARSGGGYSLRGAPSRGEIVQVVDMADRSDIDALRGNGLLDTRIDTANAIVLTSQPLREPLEVSGLLSGRLELIANKRDFDFSVTVYELTADGQYFELPPYTSRASHVGSLSVRRLLTAGKRERLDYRSRIRFASRKMATGSRVVVVLAILKSPAQQINYGSGKPVSEESIADAGEPLRIRWLGSSFVELPVWRRGAAARSRRR